MEFRTTVEIITEHPISRLICMMEKERQSNMNKRWIDYDKMINYLKKSCYCERGEGTFISDTKDGPEMCVYCHIISKITKGDK